MGGFRFGSKVEVKTFDFDVRLAPEKRTLRSSIRSVRANSGRSALTNPAAPGTADARKSGAKIVQLGAKPIPRRHHSPDNKNYYGAYGRTNEPRAFVCAVPTERLSCKGCYEGTNDTKDSSEYKP
jgi:hypothetical protein